jgi:hypothetical protein
MKSIAGRFYWVTQFTNLKILTGSSKMGFDKNGDGETTLALEYRFSLQESIPPWAFCLTVGVGQG